MNYFKKYKLHIFSFLVPFIVYFTLYLLKVILAKKTFLDSDAFAQFLPTFKYLYNVLHGNASFPYSFSKGLGGTMYGSFFYGLSSPTNILVYFFKNVELFMFITTLIKLSLSSLSMFIFMNKKNSDKRIAFLLSLAYVFSGYTILYFVNIMWLDALVLAPIVLLGVEKIIKEKKYVLYIISLLITLISNYYLGYMIVLFSIIYYIYLIYINYNGNHFFKDNFKSFFNYFIITFLTGCCVLFILIPVYIESLDFVRVDFNPRLINLNFYDIIAGVYIGFGKLSNPLNDFALLTYCGTFTIPLVINYFKTNTISKKEKKATVIVILLFILPVLFTPFNYVWHLFTYPQSFNYRYSFLLIIFFIILSSKSLKDIVLSKKDIKMFMFIFCAISISIIFTLTNNSDYYIYLTTNKIIITIFFLLLSFIVIKQKKIKYILIVGCLELFFNVSWIFINNNFAFRKKIDEFDEYIENFKNDNLISETGRFENITVHTYNNSLLYNYLGTNVFLSSTNKSAIVGFQSLNGKISETNYTIYSKYNTISDSIMGVEYILTPYENPNYITIDTPNLYFRDVFLQKNPNTLSIAFVASVSTKKVKEITDLNSLETFLNSINNTNVKIFKRLDIEKKDNKNYIILNNQKYSELYSELKDFPINISSEKSNFNLNYSMIYTNNEEKIELNYAKEVKEPEIYGFDYNEFKKIMQNTNNANIKFEKNKINISANEIKNNQILIITIPYEKGWTVKIDNKETNYYKVLNAFIGIDLPEGNHNIELVYIIPGLELGISLSLISATLLITYCLKKLNSQQKIHQ